MSNYDERNDTSGHFSSNVGPPAPRAWCGECGQWWPKERYSGELLTLRELVSTGQATEEDRDRFRSLTGEPAKGGA